MAILLASNSLTLQKDSATSLIYLYLTLKILLDQCHDLLIVNFLNNQKIKITLIEKKNYILRVQTLQIPKGD